MSRQSSISLPIKPKQTGETIQERLTDNAYNQILPPRYLRKDSDGELIEKQEDLFERVAKNIALAEAIHSDYDLAISPRHIKPDHPHWDEIQDKVFGPHGKVLLNEENIVYVKYDRFINDVPEELQETLEETAEEFTEMMEQLQFIPNTPTLANAGDDLQQLAACFVTSPADDLADIHETAKQAALIFQSGGGVGYSFSMLRPYGEAVGSTGGIASGPLSFMRTYDQLCGTIAQGGMRRGAQMGVMRISHPDVIQFIHAKNKAVSLARVLRLNDPDDPTYTSFGEALEEARSIIDNGKVPKHLRNAVEGHLSNFNISVGITEDFMEAVQNDELFTFINPQTEEPHISTKETKEMYSWYGLDEYVEVGEELEVPAREIWDRVIDGAYENGEPGVIYMDRVNEDHAFPVKSTPGGSGGEYEVLATNPCAEEPLMEHDACNLGHINLSTVANPYRTPYTEFNGDIDEFLDQAIDWEDFDYRIEKGVRFLDNVITMSKYPTDDISEKVRKSRKIGLGIMGLAQLYIQLGVEYGSSDGDEVARQLMTYINQESKKASKNLAVERQSFENWSDSKYAKPEKHRDWFQRQTGYDPEDWPGGYPIRNYNTTTIAPTGTTSMVGNTTGGCEPIYNVAYYKNVSDDIQGDEMLVEFDDYFLRVLEENDVDVENVKWEAQNLMEKNEFDGVEDLGSVPDVIGDLFVTTGDLRAKEHASVQCALQDGVDAAISKTVNAPASATKDDAKDVFEYIYENGGKAVTFYRDGSREKQVLTTEGSSEDEVDTDEQIEDECPDCGEQTMIPQEGCSICSECGFSPCS